MKKYVLLLLLSVLFSSCAQHSSYDTARFREREYESGRITLTEDGLTQEQIQAITSTKPPSESPIDLSIIIIKDPNISNELEQLFVSKVIAGLRKSQNIKRIVPIPRYLLPEKVSFPMIQELGIRTLTEYVIVFIVDRESFFRWTKLFKTKFEITSAADFFIVDSQTTAILASDRLFSETTFNDNLFKTGEARKAQEEIFTEQGELLGEKLGLLFANPR